MLCSRNTCPSRRQVSCRQSGSASGGVSLAGVCGDPLKWSRHSAPREVPALQVGSCSILGVAWGQGGPGAPGEPRGPLTAPDLGTAPGEPHGRRTTPHLGTAPGEPRRPLTTLDPGTTPGACPGQIYLYTQEGEGNGMVFKQNASLTEQTGRHSHACNLLPLNRPKSISAETQRNKSREIGLTNSSKPWRRQIP